jgi:hypothetical protein
MKTGPDALGIAENESGSAKQANGSQRRRYSLKRVLARKTRKSDLTPSVSPKMSPGAQNMKTDLTPSVPPKMSPGAQNMKTGPDALRTAENVFGRAKHENGS